MAEMRPCVLIRHDLDEISKKEFYELIKYEKGIAGKFTYFLLAHQVVKDAPILFPKNMPDYQKKLCLEEYQCFITKKVIKNLNGHGEFALHSEAKPKNISKSNIVKLYTNNLRKQKKSFESVFGYCNGHSGHCENYTIFAQKYANSAANREIDTKIINLASSLCKFDWVSCYKDIGHFTLSNTRFRQIARPYCVGETVIFPIGWDDNYCYYNASYPKRIYDNNILKSMELRLTECQIKKLPLVVSLHPMYFLETNRRYLYSREIIAKFIDIVIKRGILISTFSSYSAQIRHIVKRVNNNE